VLTWAKEPSNSLRILSISASGFLTKSDLLAKSTRARPSSITYPCINLQNLNIIQNGERQFTHPLSDSQI